MNRKPRVTPKMVNYFRSLSNHSDFNTNTHMFREDLRLSIMPIGGRAKKTSFSAGIEGEQEDRTQALELCSSLSRFKSRDEIVLICDAVAQIANDLSSRGRAVYEIASPEDNTNYFNLYNIPIHGLYKLPGYYVQHIRKAEQTTLKKRFVILSSKHLWELRMPPKLGGTKRYRKMLSKLRKVDHLGPDFWQKDLASNKQTVDSYNFQTYVNQAEIYYSRITRRWGWNRRDYTQTNKTEFFVFYRIITHRWAQVVLREYIIDQLNRLLMRLKINAKIVVSGLPSSEEILRVREDLLNGKIQFGEASDRVSI